MRKEAIHCYNSLILNCNLKKKETSLELVWREYGKDLEELKTVGMGVSLQWSERVNEYLRE